MKVEGHENLSRDVGNSAVVTDRESYDSFMRLYKQRKHQTDRVDELEQKIEKQEKQLEQILNLLNTLVSKDKK